MPPSQPPKHSSNSPVILTLSIIKALGENSRQIPVTNYTAYVLGTSVVILL